MKARIVSGNKTETYEITSFELINRNRNKYFTMVPEILATIKDIITIDLKDVQEIYIKEDEK